VISFALQQRLDRASVVLALGGGVVGDLAGFVASTFMRGIPFVQLPTTVLAHDSSVGGKVAINHPLGKNMIGAFYQPVAVIYDTSTLNTLPAREISSGFAEVLKHAFIWDPSFVDWLEKHSIQCLNLKEPYLTESLSRASAIKSEVVKQDERESGLRAILNFGHTFGHAFEALGNYQMFSHGEAVSIGMALAAVVSERVYGAKVSRPIISLLKSFGLPVDWHGLPWSFEEVLHKMYLDKKVREDKLRLVLLKEMGQPMVTDQVSEALLRECWQNSIDFI
jgi:3-dehydroquinate synthase